VYKRLCAASHLDNRITNAACSHERLSLCYLCHLIYGDDVFVLYIMRAHRDIEEISSFVVKLILLSYMLAVLIPGLFYVS